MGGHKAKIAVVDDDADMSTALRRLLQAAGYQINTFRSAEALIDAGVAAGMHCLVLDIQLPGMSGLALSQRLREIGLTVPVIFITAYDDPDSRALAMQAGAVACMTKPFSGSDLLGAVSRALELRSDAVPDTR